MEHFQPECQCFPSLKVVHFAPELVVQFGPDYTSAVRGVPLFINNLKHIIMVRIADYKARKNSIGETFLALIVQGGLSMVQSKESGLFYATAKKASIPSTFDEETCKSLIGQELEGTVERAECEPYFLAFQFLTLFYRFRTISSNHFC